MTRINSAISVKCLTDEHLLAEHREIKRLPQCLKKSKKLCIPDKFRLGAGHIKFFLDKMGFVKNRYKMIYEECLRRGFSVVDYSENWDSVGNEYMNGYEPTREERELLIERISDRLMNSSKKFWHYCGKKISKEDAIVLLNSDNNK